MRDSRYEGTGPEPADVVSAEPRALAFRPAWGLVLVLLVAALAAAVAATLHYRGEATAARRQLAVRNRGRAARDSLAPAVHQHGRPAGCAAACRVR